MPVSNLGQDTPYISPKLVYFCTGKRCGPLKKSDLQIREREGFKTGILRLSDEMHEECAHFIMAQSRQHISVHEFRKNIKKIRSILRLVRDEIGRDKYREMNGYYREVANELAALRDDTSQVELLENMRRQVDNARVRTVISRAVGQVKRKRKKEFASFYKKKLHLKVRDEMFSLKEKVHELEFEGHPEFFLLMSLKRVHQRARSAMEITDYVRNDEMYHYLRKQVKYLMYLMMIINRTWPSYFKAYISELDKLSELLGNLHDLNLFNEHIHEEKLIVLRPAQKKDMLKHIYRRRSSLQKAIRRLGEKIFSESSEDFSMAIYNFWVNSEMKKEHDGKY